MECEFVLSGTEQYCIHGCCSSSHNFVIVHSKPIKPGVKPVFIGIAGRLLCRILSFGIFQIRFKRVVLYMYHRFTIGRAMLLLLLLSSSGLLGATVVIQGGQTNQMIEGFGVNANHRSWNNQELKPVLDRMIDEAGMTLFRVIYDNANWEENNDNADSKVFNWSYYNPIYANAEFTKLWDMLSYLNQRGITNGAILSFMGYGPAWLCGSADFNNQVLTAGLEDEWAEMIASAVVYV